MRKNKVHEHHIGSRILVQMLLLLAAAFLCIFLAFNIMLRQYIMNTVRSQLDAISATMSSLSADEDRDRDRVRKENYPDLSNVLDNKIRTEAKAFNADGDYSVTDRDQNDSEQEVESVAEAMKEKQIPLAGAKYVYIKTDTQKEYYISSIKDPVLADTYMIFFVDVTAISSFSDTINMMLGLILAVALIVSFFLADILTRTVTCPVKELSDFAEQLGSGDFKRREMHFNDIEFNGLAESMNKSAEQLDTYDREQRTFFQNVSHELRTPLMSIRCYAEGITSGVMDAVKSGAVIISETDRLTGLVEDLLYISRIDKADTISENMKPGDIRETVAMCATALDSVAKKNGVNIVYDFDEYPVEMKYNETHIYRAVSNLISNALRYADKEIVLGCHSADGKVIITVNDDGKGIDEEDMPHIFERFYKGKGGKNGIGLAIVKTVADLHGGSVSADCSHGTTFTLTF